MSTTLHYNGISIHDCTLRQFEEEAVYDESQTDVIGHKVVIVVNGLVYQHPDPNAIFGVGGAHAQMFAPQQGNAVLTFKYVRKQLMEQRKTLILQFHGQEVFRAFPIGSKGDVVKGGDVNNGPKPQQVSITKVVGKVSMRVDYRIECMVVDCKDNSNSEGVLSNRWSVAEDIDVNWFSTRVISGKLRIASPKLLFGPQAFRKWVMPVLQDGFRRERIHCLATTDGLTLEYEIVDKTVAAACPFPGTSWRGTHTESSHDGVSTRGHIHIEMNGPANMKSKKPLIAACVSIGKKKLDIASFGNPGKWILKHASVVDHLDTSKVEFNLEIQRAGADEPLQDLSFKTGPLGKWITSAETGGPYNRMHNAIPAHFADNSPAGMLVAYLQTPCNNDHVINFSGQGLTAIGTPKRGQVFMWTGPDGALIQDSVLKANISPEQKKNPYTYYKMTIEYKTNHNRIQLPIADSSTATPDSSAIIELSKPTSQAIVTVVAERSGAWPELPSPDDVASAYDGGDWKLITVQEIPVQPKVTASGSTKQALFSLSSKYVYAMTQKIKGPLLVGRDPTMKNGALPKSVPNSVLNAGLFNPGTFTITTSGGP